MNYKIIYECNSNLEAHGLRLYLESNGIDALLTNENTNVSAPPYGYSVWSRVGLMVPENDIERTLDLIEKFSKEEINSAEISSKDGENGEREPEIKSFAIFRGVFKGVYYSIVPVLCFVPPVLYVLFPNLYPKLEDKIYVAVSTVTSVIWIIIIIAFVNFG